MRRRAGQCWGLCSARCASHRPQQGSCSPFDRHARPPPGQAVQHARRSVPPSPPLLSKWGRVAAGAPRQHCSRAGAATPVGSKSGHPAKRDAASGRDGHTGAHPARPRQAASRALPDDLQCGKGGQGDAAPCGRSPTAPPTTEKKGRNAMTNKQYFKLEELKHKYNQELMKAQETNNEQEATYFSGVLNGIQIAARELLSK